jgi:hypothetical protein
MAHHAARASDPGKSEKLVHVDGISTTVIDYDPTNRPVKSARRFDPLTSMCRARAKIS